MVWGTRSCAAGRRASDAAASWQHAAKHRSAAEAGRIANQERQRIERSEVIESGQVPTARQVGGEKQTKQVSETSKRAAIRPEGGHVDLNLHEGAARVWFFRRNKVEIGNSRCYLFQQSLG
jgi:hypothetical protein